MIRPSPLAPGNGSLEQAPGCAFEGAATGTFVFAPSWHTVEEAIDWFEANGYDDFYLWRGEDNMIRGSGRK